MTYRLNYLQGQVDTIQKGDNITIPIDEGNSDYREFVVWNKAQPVDKKLDVNATIEVPKPVPPIDMAKEMEALKARVTDLEKAI